MNKQIMIRSLPQGNLAHDNFELVQGEIPKAQTGQVVVRTILLSQDAANRAWMQGATYRDAIGAGEVMSSGGIGEVIETKSDKFKLGDLISADIGWQEYAAVDESSAAKIPDFEGPLTHAISLLGVAGKTAYHGLINVPGIHAGETLVVSAAAGSVGSIVGQIGKVKGARVVGIAGGKEKCDWLVQELGFDACLDYKDESAPLRHTIGKTIPEGVDVYFDNTGGDILQAALFAMKLKGRISCCGAVSMYDGKPKPGPFGIPGLLVTKRLRMEGFLVSDYSHLDTDANHNLSQWAASGQLKVVEDVLQGIEAAPGGLIGLLAGENRGKRMIQVAPDPR